MMDERKKQNEVESIQKMGRIGAFVWHGILDVAVSFVKLMVLAVGGVGLFAYLILLLHNHPTISHIGELITIFFCVILISLFFVMGLYLSIRDGWRKWSKKYPKNKKR